MASKTASKGINDTLSGNSSKPDCERSAAMTTSGNSARLGSSVAHSPLFKLSAELRNTIYRLVLVQDHAEFEVVCVAVDSLRGITEPALLLSNKIVRSEASGIFYHENHWNCEVRNYDPAPVLLLQSKLKMPFSEHEMVINVTSVRRDISYGTWRNLVSWLHLCHKRKCPPPFHEDDDLNLFGRDAYAEASVLRGLFDVVKRCPEMPSDMLDCVIASMYPAWESGAYNV